MTSYNMAWPNKFFSMIQSPFKNSSQSLFITGGYDGTSDVNKAAVISFYNHYFYLENLSILFIEGIKLIFNKKFLLESQWFAL